MRLTDHERLILRRLRRALVYGLIFSLGLSVIVAAILWMYETWELAGVVAFWLVLGTALFTAAAYVYITENREE